MDITAIKDLGTFVDGEAVCTDLTAPCDGVYTFEYFNTGKLCTLDVNLLTGDDICFPNSGLNETALIKFRVKPPTACNCGSYLTDVRGHVLFSYRNMLSCNC